MRTRTYSLLALVADLLLASGTFNLLHAQEISKASSRKGEAELALQYFNQIGDGKAKLDDYLKSIRPVEISAERRTLVVASIRKGDLVTPSPDRQAKLDALQPVLKYHERATLPIEILRFPGPLAWAAFLEGAAVLVSEDALDLLTTEELQAVIAHELGHEYFAAEFELARKNKEWDKAKEVELRCDAISIITMKSLGLNPNALVSGVTKLTRFNEEHGVRSRPNLEPSLNDRARITALIQIRFGSVVLVHGQAQESAPQNAIQAEAFNKRGVAASEAGNFEEAIKLYESAIRLRPDYAIAFRNLGSALYRARRSAEAITTLKEAIQLKFDYAEAYNDLGAIYAEMGGNDEAIKLFERAVQLEADPNVALYNLGCVLIRLKRFREAASALKRATQLNPNNPEYYINLSYALSNTKHYREAITRMARAVSLRPNDADAQFFLGTLYLMVHDKQSALIQYESLKAINPSLAERLYRTIHQGNVVNVLER